MQQSFEGSNKMANIDENFVVKTGLASSYQLGNGSTTRLNVWTMITTVSDIIDAVGNSTASAVLTASGTLYGSGAKNNMGQGSSGTITSFTAIATGVVDIGASRAGICYVKTDDLFYTSGYNGYGSQGDGTTTAVYTIKSTANVTTVGKIK